MNMEKTPITEDMNLQKEWYEQAKQIKAMEELTLFIAHVMNDYDHDYGTAVHAIAASALAAAYYGAYSESVTGFQMSLIMWMIAHQLVYDDNVCGLKMIDYDDMLYPQYEDKFDKTISPQVWENLQKEAKKRLEVADEEPKACAAVRNHWQSIVDGKVPFGYTVSDGV